MDIAFYEVTAPNNAMDKLTTASLVQSYSGPATIDVSDLNPTLVLENGGGGALRTANYAYITDFGRAYFIEEQIATTAENIFAYKLRMDPLQSFSASILDLEVVVERQTENYDMYLPDNRIPVDCRKAISYRKFGSSPFGIPTLTMIVLGGDS